MSSADISAAPWPSYSEAERAAVDAVLRSGKVNYWTGEEVRAFEREYAHYLGVRNAIALANGTVALELALRAWNIGEGDEVIVTPRSFIASASCVALLGAHPKFVDVDRESGNIRPDAIASAITPRTRAIIVVHLGGWPAEMNPIMEIARSHGLKVLEDCAQAHGARYMEKPVGSLADASAFSFCQDKIITTGGEGGLLATNDPEVWSRAWSFKDHGKTWDSVYQRSHGPGFRWVHDALGTNFRMTELQGAIGRIQLRKLADWSERRSSNARVLIEGLGAVAGLRVPKIPEHVRHAFYRFYAYVESRDLKSGWGRDRIVAEIAAGGVSCFSGSCSEIYRERAFDATRFRPQERLAIARELGETSLALLVHPTLEREHMERAVATVREVLERAVR